MLLRISFIFAIKLTRLGSWQTVDQTLRIMLIAPRLLVQTKHLQLVGITLHVRLRVWFARVDKALHRLVTLHHIVSGNCAQYTNSSHHIVLDKCFSGFRLLFTPSNMLLQRMNDMTDLLCEYGTAASANNMLIKISVFLVPQVPSLAAMFFIIKLFFRSSCFFKILLCFCSGYQLRKFSPAFNFHITFHISKIFPNTPNFLYYLSGLKNFLPHKILYVFSS